MNMGWNSGRQFEYECEAFAASEGERVRNPHRPAASEGEPSGSTRAGAVEPGFNSQNKGVLGGPQDPRAIKP